MSFPIYPLRLVIRYASSIPFSDLAAREWAGTAMTWYEYELGVDSEQVQEMKEVIRSPQAHRFWGTRRPQSVGLPLKRT